MKNGVLICSGTYCTKNIGDYIQSVAQEQYYDKVDTYVEREQMNSFQSSEKVRTIMNGWFMHKPENFPPSDSIMPLFVSFHIVPDVAGRLLSPEVISYLKKYEPIGARDTGTKELLESKGVKSYFSGCLTICLNRKYKSDIHDDTVIFVDPYYDLYGKRRHLFFRWLHAFSVLFRNLRPAVRLGKIFNYEFKSKVSYISARLDRILHAAAFYDTYSKLFSDEVLFEAIYICHTVEQGRFKDDDEKMDYARLLIHRYAKAKYVVTSRIHCALPCLGVETPVLFVTSDNLEGFNPIRSAGRFGGLIEWFHCLRWKPEGVIMEEQELKDVLKGRKIDKDFIFKNKRDYISYRNDLDATVSAFVAG